MPKLFGGMLVAVAGLVVAIAAFYYAWASGTPGFPPDAYQKYQFYSMILGVLSIGVILGGIYMVIISIRKMNRDNRESQHRHERLVLSSSPEDTSTDAKN